MSPAGYRAPYQRLPGGRVTARARFLLGPRSLSSQGCSAGGPGAGVLSGLGLDLGWGWGRKPSLGERTPGDTPFRGLGARALPALPMRVWLSPAPQKASEGQDLELGSRQEVEDLGDAPHVNARHLIYPNSPVLRFPVPDEKVPWEVSAVQAEGPVLQWGAALPQSLPRSWARGWVSPLQAPRVMLDRRGNRGTQVHTPGGVGART